MMPKYMENSRWEDMRRVGGRYGVDTNIDYVKALKKSKFKRNQRKINEQSS